MIGRLAALFGVLLLAFVSTTWLALESGGVGVVETQRADGSVRRTHVWPVHIDGVIWLEAGTPTNGWYLDVLSDPELWLDLDGERARYRAVPVETEAAYRDLRVAIRARFGWRDRWVGLWVDSSGSIAVRLDPAT